MNKSLYLIIGVIVLFVVFLGAAAYYKNSSSNDLPIPGPEIVASDWTRGTGKVILMEFSDFQCPACRAYFPIVEQLMAEEGNNVTFVYRHFPLPQHGNALPAARAAEAAGKQGKFWPMYEKIFSTQDTWAEASDSPSIFRGYAEEFALDLSKYDLDANDSNTKAKVLNDYKSGINMKVEGTPTFFLNGQKIKNPENLEEFKLAIMAAAASLNMATSTP